MRHRQKEIRMTARGAFEISARQFKLDKIQLAALPHGGVPAQ
jgi:hypothetical protein